ncbi:hypothetical protein JCM8547_004381 [Rhodosporidiobolus lusitaniae]
MKRLILCCDGTLMDADSEQNPDLYTNIAKISRALLQEDHRHDPPVEQIKMYQSGVGTDEAAFGGIVTGALGRGMLQKVKDLYDFLCLNYEVGDEIFLFGFSRGAYTVRLLTSLISIIGILSPARNLHLFPAIFEALDDHKGDHSNDDEKAVLAIQKLLRPLSRFRTEQQKALGASFLIKCVGVFDTVGTRGRPSALRRAPSSPSTPKFNSFGLDESLLDPCVELAFQALALDERRIDYLPVLWRLSPFWPHSEAKKRGQRVEQVWFAGAHADVGGGYEEGDLGFVTLGWMVGVLEGELGWDKEYLGRVTGKTAAEYGEMAPHQSRIGEFRLAAAVDRPFPTSLDPLTNELFHPSILSQPPSHLRPDLLPFLRSPGSARLFTALTPFEQRLKEHWTEPDGSVKPPKSPREEKEPPFVKDEVREKEGKRSRSAPAVATLTALASNEQKDIHTDSESGSDVEHKDDASSSVFSSSPPPSPDLPKRPSSVTSFTDNESLRSPSASPSPSPPLPSRPAPPPVKDTEDRSLDSNWVSVPSPSDEFPLQLQRDPHDPAARSSSSSPWSWKGLEREWRKVRNAAGRRTKKVVRDGLE